MTDPRADQSCSLSIVVPTFREAANMAELSCRLFEALESSPEYADAELIIVDDNSNDGIDRVISEGAYADRTRLIVRTTERGLASAVLRGLAEARGRLLVVMDADLSHPPEAVPKLVAPLAAGAADMVVGSRYAPGGSTDTEWSWFRRLNSRVATWLARPFAAITDPMSGFFAMPRGVFARAAFLNPTGYKIALELMVKCRCHRVAEVPIHFADRQRGQSKLTMREQFRYVEHLSRLYDFRFPRLIPVAKFLIVTLLGFLGGLAWLAATTVGEPIASPIHASGAAMDAASRAIASRAVLGSGSVWTLFILAYWPAVAFNLLAYWRYIKQMKGFVPIRRPVFDFVAISFYEWLTFVAAVAVVQHALGGVAFAAWREQFALAATAFAAAFITRFLLRKLAGHDIRGLPTGAAAVRP